MEQTGACDAAGHSDAPPYSTYSKDRSATRSWRSQGTDSEPLRALEESHAFVIPLDRSHSGTAAARCSQRISCSGSFRHTEPDVIAKLHVRAADWFEANGAPRHGRRAPPGRRPRKERCTWLRMLASLMPSNVLRSGRISTVPRSLTGFGGARGAAYPPLAVLAGWVTALVGESAEAQRWAAVVDEASFDAVPTDGAASFASSRAMLRAMLCAAGPEQMMAEPSSPGDGRPLEHVSRHRAQHAG